MLSNIKDAAVEAMLRKTKMCRFYERGACKKGEACGFAHSTADVQSRPDFYKTRLCIAFQCHGTCRDGAACKYAHGESDIRKETETSGVPSKTPLLSDATNSNVGISQGQSPMVFVLCGVPAGFQVPMPMNDQWNRQCSRPSMRVARNVDINDPNFSRQSTGEGFDVDSESTSSQGRSYASGVGDWHAALDDVELASTATAEPSPSMDLSDVRSVTDTESNTPLQPPPPAVMEGRSKPGKAMAAVLAKTKLCKFFRKGFCNKGQACNFAHGPESLQSRPDPYRSRLCASFQKSGSCKNGANCKYAHGPGQLRNRAHQADVSQSKAIEEDVQKDLACDELFVTLEDKPTPRPATFTSGLSITVKHTFLHFEVLQSKTHATLRRSRSFGVVQRDLDI